jgi:LysM repeat protein
MRFHFFTLAFLCSISIAAQSQRITDDQYIAKYKGLAIKEMKRTGIPASITMAQALLESDNGNSTLATQSNNHFGVKCHADWKGERVYRDDDQKDDCFRVYKNAAESFADHSDLLRFQKRYAFLFDLKTTDYKGWAQGLKKAGYATNPQYPQLLINIIEKKNLQALDEGREIQKMATSPRKKQSYDEPEYVVTVAKHPLQTRNRRTYIVAKNGDTFVSLAQELNMMEWQFPKYNELPKDYKLKAGDILFTEPKRRRADVGNKEHIVTKGETMYSISQLYGVKLHRLYYLNRMKEPDQPQVGDTLRLRWRKWMW